MTSVWPILPPKKIEKSFGKHPTQKPLALLERIIEASTAPRDLVLDPFQGSGTTGVAAVMLGRRYVGIEQDSAFHKVAFARIRDCAGSTRAAANAASK